ncbi:MAG: preprotein translocase subunit YajC [Phycisphaerales bacterium]
MLQPTDPAATAPRSMMPKSLMTLSALAAGFVCSVVAAAPGVLPPVDSGGAPAPPAGTTEAANKAAPSLFGGGMFPFILFGFLGLLLVTTILGPRKEKKRREAMMTALKRHDRVQTIGGVVGSIVDLKPDSIVLKVDESSNTRITFARSAVQQVLSSRETSANEPELANSAS